METSAGHVFPGLGFFLVGLWHMLNQIKLHVTNPKSNFNLLWFPSPKIKYIELYTIIAISLTFLSKELLLGLQRHTTLDHDGTIPFNQLRKFEHANIAITFVLYAIFALILDKTEVPAKYGLTQLLGALIFGQELLIFHLHSTDHMGVEGQYHFLLQILIFVSLSTTLLGFSFPNSFINGFVRSYSIMFQGIWLVVIGVMLWTPEFIPKGCFYKSEHKHQIIKCHGDEATQRAKSLINILFGWYVIGFTFFVIMFYLVMYKCYSKNIVCYESLPTKFEEQREELIHEEHSHKGSLEMGKLCVVTLDMK